MVLLLSLLLLLWFLLYKSFFDSFNHWITRFLKKRTWLKIYPLHMPIRYPHWKNSALKLSSQAPIWQTNLHWFEDYAKLKLREKCPNTEVCLVRIFQYSVQMQENTDQKNLRIWTLFTQWKLSSAHGSHYIAHKEDIQCIRAYFLYITVILVFKTAFLLWIKVNLIYNCLNAQKFLRFCKIRFF